MCDKVCYLLLLNNEIYIKHIDYYSSLLGMGL